MLLTIGDLHLSFGGISALRGIDLEMNKGEIIGLIGANGSGKTSLLNCICGYYRPSRGTITFKGEEITGLPPHRIAALGVGRTYQNIELFGGLSVLENLLTGRHLHMKGVPFGMTLGALYFGPGRKEEVRHREAVEEIIELLEMEAWRRKPVSECSYGMRKRVALGRALAQESDLLLLDEPTAGLSSESREDLVRCILDVHENKGITMVLVEHNMDVLFDIADRIVGLDQGNMVAEGDPDTVLAALEAAAVRSRTGPGTSGAGS
jgi:branched-chain amino acid transport system ATP-binding protein